MPQQLFFDLDFALPPRRAAERATGRARKVFLQRAVMRWLEASDSPTGCGANVVTRISRLRADVAAFWSSPVRNRHEAGPSQILIPSKTVIVQCHAEREECWPDCIKSREILPQLKALKSELRDAEEQIRLQEPELREANTLFEEYAEWNYERSKNRRYHRLKRAIEKMAHGLYHGTKFERIRQVQLADHLYLAVPHGMVEEEELADGWGLLWVEPDLSITVVSAPEDKECLPSNRLHLVQNIAAANKSSELLFYGVSGQGDGVGFVKRMRRRRAEENPRMP